MKSTDFHSKKCVNFCAKISSRIWNFCICIFAFIDPSALTRSLRIAPYTFFENQRLRVL